MNSRVQGFPKIRLNWHILRTPILFIWTGVEETVGNILYFKANRLQRKPPLLLLPMPFRGGGGEGMQSLWLFLRSSACEKHCSRLGRAVRDKMMLNSSPSLGLHSQKGIRDSKRWSSGQRPPASYKLRTIKTILNKNSPLKAKEWNSIVTGIQIQGELRWNPVCIPTNSSFWDCGTCHLHAVGFFFTNV